MLLLLTHKAAVLAGAILAMLYALVAGFSVPSQRTLYMLAVWSGRQVALTRVLAYTLLVVVALDVKQRFVRHGHEVVLSNSKGPDSLAELVRSIGSNAKSGTVKEAAKQDIVILAVRWEQAEQALAEVSDWNGLILVDATNRPLEEDPKGRTASEVIASYAPRARVIKALNTLVVNWIQDYSDKKPKLVLFLSGDDTEAKRKLSSALEETGFAPVDLGGLIDGGKLQERGAPLSGLHLDLVKRLGF